MPKLLIVTHCPSPNTESMRDALSHGVKKITDSSDDHCLEVRELKPLEAAAEDVLWADAILLGTTENFGSMAGRVKDFFERIYYPCLEKTQGKLFAFYIRAGNDGLGTEQSAEKITTGLRWHMIQPPLICRGEFDPVFLEQCEELGMTVAAGLDAGIF